MADMEPQINQLPGNSFPYSTRQNHVLGDASTTPVACTGQTEDQWGFVPPVVESGALQSTLRNSYHDNAANYGHDIAGYPQLLDPADPYAYPNVGLAQGVSEPVKIPFPENQGGDPFDNGLQRVPDPTRAALPDSSAHQVPVLDQSAAENLRRLASRYLNHPNSQVDMVRIEPGSPGRYKVVIVLEMPEFL